MRLTKYIIGLIILVVSLCGGGYATAQSSMPSMLPDSTSRTYRHVDALKQLAIHRDTTRAKDIWLDLVRSDSTYAPALYYLSLVNKHDDEAVEYARRAYTADSTNKWYTENYANKLILSGKYDAAISVYRRLVRLDAKNLQSYHALAIIYSAKRMPYSAIAILDSAELRIGYNSYLGQIKQRLLLDTRQYDRAIEEGKRRVREHPYDVEARFSLALSYDTSGNDSLAEQTYEEAFRLDTTNVETITALVDYYYSRGDFRRMLDYEERLFRDKSIAVEDKEQRLEQYTNDTEFYGQNYLRVGSIIVGLAMDYPTNRTFIKAYAMHLIGGGHTDEAYDYLMRHIGDKEATADDYIMLLQYMMFLEKSEAEIEALMAQGVERFADDEQMLSFEGFYYTEKGDYSRALKIFKRGLAAAKKSGNDKLRSQWLGYIGDTYHMMGQQKKSFMAYADALDYDQNNVAVLNNYAYYLSLTGRGLDKALAMSELAIALEKSNATYIDTYAWILHLLGRSEEAKRVMLRALSLDGQRDPDILAHYGDILWALGEKFMAETYWQKAVERGYDSEAMKSHIAQLKQQN